MSLRNPKPWELCKVNTFGGVHLWVIDKITIYNESTGIAKNKAKKESRVICNVCGKQPPNKFRGTLFDEITEQLEKVKESQRVARLYRSVARRRRR